MDDRMETAILGTVEGNMEEGAVVQGRVRIAEDTTITKGVTIRGPASIGSNTTIAQGTYVGPYASIGSGCTLFGCEVENTIIVRDSKIDCKRRIVDSLIGSNTHISDSEDSLPRGSRFIIGENTVICV